MKFWELMLWGSQTHASHFLMISFSRNLPGVISQAHASTELQHKIHQHKPRLPYVEDITELKNLSRKGSQCFLPEMMFESLLALHWFPIGIWLIMKPSLPGSYYLPPLAGPGRFEGGHTLTTHRSVLPSSPPNWHCTQARVGTAREYSRERSLVIGNSTLLLSSAVTAQPNISLYILIILFLKDTHIGTAHT